MKKFFTFAAALSLCFTLNSQQLKWLNFGTGGVIGYDEPGMCALGMSADGKYVCGSLEQGIGYFIGNADTNSFRLAFTDDDEGAELRNVSNTGVAIGYNGPGVTYTIDGVETVLQVPDSGMRYVLGEDISNDGSVLVGSIVGDTFTTEAGFSRDGGPWTYLPMPSEEELGMFANRGSAAKFVSGDGSVILGFIGSFGPAIIWRLDENGDYQYKAIYREYLTLDDATADNPFSYFAPCGLSNNGRYAILTAAYAHLAETAFPVVYDIENDDLTAYDELQDIDPSPDHFGLTPSAIADDGTFIGIVGRMYYNFGGFIMYPGEKQAKLLADAFPEFKRDFEILDMMTYHIPIAISADGRYIAGYGWYSADPEDYDEPAYFTSYRLDTKADSGVNRIEEESLDSKASEYYSVNGMKLNRPMKGINIVRMSDGSVRKEVR